MKHMVEFTSEEAAAILISYLKKEHAMSATFKQRSTDGTFYFEIGPRKLNYYEQQRG